jgi:hypothetical protein
LLLSTGPTPDTHLKIGDDIVALAAPAKGDDWAAMRSDFLSREPYLIDLKAQNDKFQRRAVIEQNANLGTNDFCEKIALNDFLPALNDYTNVLEEEFSVLKSAPTPTQAAITSMANWGKQEDAAMQRLSAYFANAKAKRCEK